MNNEHLKFEIARIREELLNAATDCVNSLNTNTEEGKTRCLLSCILKAQIKLKEIEYVLEKGGKQ